MYDNFGDVDEIGSRQEIIQTVRNFVMTNQARFRRRQLRPETSLNEEVSD